MLLDLRKLSGEFEQVERRYAPQAFQGGDDFAVRAPVVLALEVRKDRNRYHLTGAVETELELVCSRCLEAYARPVRAPFDLRYLPQSANTGEGEREVEEDDLTTAYYRDETIDLGDLVREQLYLALPMKPLCREDCRGLCAECGANLNLTTCGCARRWEDPRLAALRALLDERKD
jgi:uncharacterized protein